MRRRLGWCDGQPAWWPQVGGGPLNTHGSDFSMWRPSGAMGHTPLPRECMLLPTRRRIGRNRVGRKLAQNRAFGGRSRRSADPRGRDRSRSRDQSVLCAARPYEAGRHFESLSLRRRTSVCARRTCAHASSRARSACFDLPGPLAPGCRRVPRWWGASARPSTSRVWGSIRADRAQRLVHESRKVRSRYVVHCPTPRCSTAAVELGGRTTHFWLRNSYGRRSIVSSRTSASASSSAQSASLPRESAQSASGADQRDRARSRERQPESC